MSSRIAAHVGGDMIKLKKRDADLEMGHARRDLDWERQFAVAMNPSAPGRSGPSGCRPIPTAARCAGGTTAR